MRDQSSRQSSGLQVFADYFQLAEGAISLGDHLQADLSFDSVSRLELLLLLEDHATHELPLELMSSLIYVRDVTDLLDSWSRSQ